MTHVLDVVPLYILHQNERLRSEVIRNGGRRHDDVARDNVVCGALRL